MSSMNFPSFVGVWFCCLPRDATSDLVAVYEVRTEFFVTSHLPCGHLAGSVLFEKVRHDRVRCCDEPCWLVPCVNYVPLDGV